MIVNNLFCKYINSGIGNHIMGEYSNLYHIYIHVHIYIYMHIHVCLCAYTCMCICVHVYMHIYACTHVFIHVRVYRQPLPSYIYPYIVMYVSIYGYIHDGRG